MSFTEIQGAVFSKLNASTTLNSLVVGIYDDVPQPEKSEDDSLFPYVVIGDDDYSNWDTDTEVGWEVNFRVHIWSRYSGKKELLEIASAVHDALNRVQMEAASYHILDVNHTSLDSFVEPDGRTRHGVLQFKLHFEVK